MTFPNRCIIMQPPDVMANEQMLQIHPISAFEDNYCWLFHQQASTDAFVVDPGDGGVILNALQELKLNLAGILITHHHADHTGGINELLQHFNIPVYGPASTRISQITAPLTHNDKLSVAGCTFSILEIPGHTLDHIAYFTNPSGKESAAPLLFCGDALFAGGCGRVFEGTNPMMYDSISRLGALPAETMIYCAHEYTLTNLDFALTVEPDNEVLKQRIKQETNKRKQQQPTLPSILELELQTNPFLRCDKPSVIKAAQQRAKNKNLGDPAQVFAVIRDWRNHF